MVSSSAPRALAARDWAGLVAAHEQRVDGLVAAHLRRASRAQTHPVEDFIFSYYRFRPAQLRRWHPGARFALIGEPAPERLAWRHYCRVDARDDAGRAVDAVGVDVAGVLAARGPVVARAREVLSATHGRDPSLGCFGLHEWAMVYRASEDQHGTAAEQQSTSWNQQSASQRRHPDVPLRLGQRGTDDVVRSHSLRCSHYDAFRFFTEPARPRNQQLLSRSDQVHIEQPGCLHAGMDVYKWAAQLLPLVGSATVLACFELARQIRAVDMRASPYDLSRLGYSPIPVETAQGRAEYVQYQRAFAQRAQQLRGELLHILADVVPA